MKSGAKKGHRKRRKRLNPINLICWIIIPSAITLMLVLDGLGFYIFNTDRIIVLGVGISVLLIPFVSEISVKNFSIKKENKSK